MDAKDQTKGAFSGVENALKGLGTSGKTAGQSLGTLDNATSRAGGALGDLSSKAARSFAQMSAMAEANARAAGSMTTVAAATTRLAETEQVATGATTRLAAAQTMVVGANERAAASAMTLGGALGKAGGAIGSMAADIAKGAAIIGGVLVAGVGKAVSVFADFEKGMSAVKAASGATASEMSQLSAAAIALGQDTQLAGIGASDAALAMEELAKGGVSVADQLGGATKGALLLASAGQIEVATAAGIATKAMNIFSLTGADVAHVADLMSAGANKSATDVGQLGAAFNQSAAVAKNAGLSIEELTGTLAFLAQRGMEGSDAGTSLKTALLALQAPTDVAAKTMEELGINVRDAQGHMLPFADIADVLKSRLAGLSDAQRDAALKTIFGNDAIRVGIALYEGGGAAIRDWTSQVDDAGNAARTGAIKNDNLAGSLDQLKAVFETAAIQVGAKFAPAVRTAADELGKFVTKAMASPEVTKALEDLGNKGAAAITKLIAKVSDPGFQKSLKEWGTAALDVGKAIVSLAGNVADVLGPPLKAAVGWFSSLDEQGKKNVIGFLAVAGAVVTFRSELGTLLSIGNTVIDMFIRKAAAKAALTKANEGLAGSAGGTAGAFTKVAAAAAPAAAAIADVAIVAAGSAVAAVAVTQGFAAAANALDQSGQRALDNTQAWNAASFAIANGGTAANGAIDGFTRLVVATGEINPSVARLSVLWNQYVGSLQAGGQSTEAVGLSMVNLAQFITGQVAPAFESAANSGSAFNNTLVGLGVGAKTLAASMTAVAPGVSAADQALGAVVISSANVGIGLGTAANSMAAVVNAAGPLTTTSTSAAAALSDLNTFGTAAAQGLNEAASAAMGAAQALSDADKVIQGLGTTAGTLSGYLRPLQAQWDELNKVTENGAHVTAAQQAEYARLAPAIQYLNAQIGANQGQTVTATLAAIANYQATQSTGAAYLAAGLAAGVAAGQVAVSGATATASGAKFADLTTKIQAVPTAVTTAVDSRSAVVAAGQMAGLRIAVVSVPTSINITANVDISGALGAIQTLRDNMPHSPAKEGPFRVLPDWTTVFETFGEGVTRAIGELPRLGVAVDSATADLQKKIADAASSVAKAITDTLGAMKVLSSFDFAKNTPSGAQLGGFAAFVANTTAMIAEIGAQFSEKALKAAGDFADAAGKVVGLLGNGVTGLMALSKFVPPALSSVLAFGKSLRSLIADLSLLAEIMTQEATDQAAAFAEGAGKVVAILGSGVSGFTALINFVAPPLAAILAFGKSLRSLIADISLLAEIMTQEAVNQAAAFAEGAGKVVGILGTGVTGFTALLDYVAPPVSAILAFGKSLRSLIADLSLLSEIMTQEAVDQAAKFAEGAGKVIAIIGSGVEGFTKLLTFVAPSQEAIDNFVFAVFEAVRKIAEMASQLSADGIKSAGEFGTAANSVLGALKTGLDVFTGLAKLVVPSAKAIDDFAIAIAYTVAKIGTIAEQIGKDGIKKAADFGASVQTIFGSLKSSMDILTNLEKFKDVAARAFDSLLAGLVGAKERAEGMVSQAKDLVLLSEEYLANMTKAAANFAKGQSLGSISGEEIGKSLGEGVVHGAQTALDSHSPSQVMAAIGKDVVDGLVQGMSDAQQDAAKKAADVASAVAKAITDTLGAATALGKLDLTTLPTGGQITGILAFTRALVAEMAASSTILSEDGAKATSLFADTAGKVAEAMTKGLTLLTGLRDYVEPAAGALYAVGKGIRDATADFAAIVDYLGTDVIRKATDFAANAGGIADAVGKGSDAFTKLASYVEPAAKAIYAMDKQLLAAVWDFAAMADLIPAEIAAKAALFAEGAGKVVDVIGKGAAAFASLSGFAYTKAIEQGIYALGKAVMAATGDFAAIMDIFGPELVRKAALFADSAGRIVAVIGNGVAGFKALDGFTGVAAASLAAFVRATGDLVKQIVGLSTGYAPALLTAAALFADTAGKALALLGSAKNFEALKDFARPVDASVAAFVATVRDLVKRFVGLAGDFTGDMLKAAGDFADSGAKSVSLVGAAIGGFSGLATFVTPGRAAVDGLLTTVRYIIARFGEMAQTMSTEGTKQLGDFGTATNAVLGGVKSAIDTFILLDKAVVPKTGDLSDLVVAVQGVTRNMATAAAALGDDAIKDATAFGSAAQGIFTALKSGLDLFIAIDKPGGWPTTDWLQPLIELMAGVLLRGGQLLTQSQELKAIADQFSANLMQAGATFGGALGLGDWALTGNLGGGGAGASGGGTTIINNYTVTGNTLLSKDTATQQQVAGIVTATQGRTIGYSTSG